MSLSKTNKATASHQLLPNLQPLTVLLRRLNTLFSSAAGLDGAFMLVQYSSPLIGFLLTRSTSYLSRTAFSSSTGLSRRIRLAGGLQILAGKISDARMLFRFVGLLPILQWLYSLFNRETAPENANLRRIQRIQAFSMLVYYPLEHTYYLASLGILNMAGTQRLRVILWACRAWAVYVMLQLVRYSEEARALSSRMAAISERREKDKTSATLLPTIAEELKEKDQGKIDTDTIVQQAGIAVEEATLLMDEQDCLRQSQSLFNGLATSLAYAPLTVHWSLERGLFGNELWSSVFGSIAALSTLRGHWQATA